MRQRVEESKRNFAKALRANATDAETALWRLLRSRELSDIKFRRQAPIGEWIADFVSFEHQLVIEADGGQHVDSLMDKQRDENLMSRGFRIMRFWNNEILQNPNHVAEAILASISNSPSPGETSGANAPQISPPSPTRGEGSKKSMS